jgi:uncharacterized protein (TIGR02118 family)
MHKVVVLLKRKAGMPVEAFQEHWRTVHGPLVAEIPGLRRYVQSHALLQGYGRGDLLFDGIGELWFDSPDAFNRGWGSLEGIAAAREEGAFLDRSRMLVMPVEVHVIKDGTIPDNAVKNIEFVNRRPGMDLDQFRRYWREVHGPIASRIPPLRRYEQNHLSRTVYDGDPTPPYDGLAITWFQSTADMKQGATTQEYAVTRADEPNFLPDGHLPIIITREHVIVG